MEWSEFTNGLLSRMGKFVMLPLVVIGVLLCLGNKVGLGTLILVGGCVYLLAALKLKAITRADCMLLPKGEKIAKMLKL